MIMNTTEHKVRICKSRVFSNRLFGGIGWLCKRKRIFILSALFKQLFAVVSVKLALLNHPPGLVILSSDSH